MLDEYYAMFGKEPPLIWGLTYKHPIYQKLMKEAIETQEEITVDMIDEAFANVNSDVIL